MRTKLDVVEDRALIRPFESPGLNPCIGKPSLAFVAEEKQSAVRGHLPPLIVRSESKYRQVATMQSANWRERLGSHSEVERFRVDVEHWLLVEGFAANQTPEFLNKLSVRTAVGRANPHVGAALRALLGEMVWACLAWMYLNRDHVRPSPRQDLDIGDQTR